jgi:hypothetical protein
MGSSDLTVKKGTLKNIKSYGKHATYINHVNDENRPSFIEKLQASAIDRPSGTFITVHSLMELQTFLSRKMYEHDHKIPIFVQGRDQQPPSGFTKRRMLCYLYPYNDATERY